MEERHRHRYEVNPKYVKELEEKGLKFVGHSTDGQRMEIMELKGMRTDRMSCYCVLQCIPLGISDWIVAKYNLPTMPWKPKVYQLVSKQFEIGLGQLCKRL